MKFWRFLAMVVFVLGAVIAILDLLNIPMVSRLENPFSIALIFMISGIVIAFLLQAKKQD